MRSNYDGCDESRSKNADSEDEDESNELLKPGSMCVIAASEHSVDTVWFIKITGEFKSTAEVADDHWHKVISGQKYILGHFLEKVNDNITSKKYKLIESKIIIFFMRVLSTLGLSLYCNFFSILYKNDALLSHLLPILILWSLSVNFTKL